MHTPLSTTALKAAIWAAVLATVQVAASWYSKDGRLIRPSHYFTQLMSSPVPIGTTVQLDIELLPAMIRIPAGHQLRLQLISEPASGLRQYSKNCVT